MSKTTAGILSPELSPKPKAKSGATHAERLKDLVAGQSCVVEKIPGGGSLEARRLPTDRIQFYWRYTADKRTERVPLGPHDPVAPPKSLRPTNRGYSIAAALEAARDLAKHNHEVPGGLRAQRHREEREAALAAATKTAREAHSLKALCVAYCEWLEKQGKSSHSEALGIFTNHLFDAFPDTARKPACEVEKREIVAAVRRLTELSKNATARKLRSYLRAAFSCAVKADSDAALPSTFMDFEVTLNPVEATAAIRGRVDKRPLTVSELRRYWHALRTVEGEIGAALRLHVVTGGQRPAQLARLRAEEDVEASSLRLFDSKGKRIAAREHLLPVTAPIRDELQRLSQAGFVLSTDGGKTSMHPSSLSAWAGEAGQRAHVEGFQLKRVRSGIETLLAAARVEKQTRGQLQSHGIGGVQDTHYDAHTYLPEKRAALLVLYKTLGI